MTCLPVYLLLRPLLAGRRVLEVGWPVPGASAVLEQSGAAALHAWCPTAVPPASPLDNEWDELVATSAASFDCVIALDLLERLPEADRGRCLEGLAHLLGPQGLIAVAVRNAQVPLLEESGSAHPGFDFWSFSRLVGGHFSHLALLGQSPMRGFYISFLQPAGGAESLSLLDDQVAEPEEASHFVAVASQVELPSLQPYSLGRRGQAAGGGGFPSPAARRAGAAPGRA